MDLLQSFVHYALTPMKRFQAKVAAQDLPNCCIHDELERKTAGGPAEVIRKKVHFETASLVDDQSDQEDSETTGDHHVEKDEAFRSIDRRGKVVRVKILMRKEEAVGLLSKCRDGGILDFKDVAEELMLLQIPKNRVSVFESSRHKKDI
ncbi:hypothetical protein Sango_2952000 [Sesamum angolense]|uniref:DUF7890 domain-containing protein n=1 Tax=Sesamum angolense TaxID=2727404 RepID=A0AAE1T5H4_9LAMI|nr:hypothetical protein Sango_2952000 [Sesamum angolense]